MKYPQLLFAEAIAAKGFRAGATVIDAPCGTGYTTALLAEKFPGCRFTGSDLSDRFIRQARKNFNSPNLSFLASDIHKLIEQQKTIENFCLINSLFLLPDPQELLKKIQSKLSPTGRLFLILPNPESENFRRYQKIEPDINSFILYRKEYENFFNNLSFRIITCEGLARIPFYGRTDTKLLYPFRNRYLHFLEKRSKSNDFGYFLITLTKY